MFKPPSRWYLLQLPELTDTPSFPSLRLPGQGASARGLQVLIELGCNPAFCQQGPPYSGASGARPGEPPGNRTSPEQETGRLENKCHTRWGPTLPVISQLGVQVAAPESWARTQAGTQGQVHQSAMEEGAGGGCEWPASRVAPPARPWPPGLAQGQPEWSAGGCEAGWLGASPPMVAEPQLPLRQPPPAGLASWGSVITALKLAGLLDPSASAHVWSHVWSTAMRSPSSREALLGAGPGGQDREGGCQLGQEDRVTGLCPPP